MTKFLPYVLAMLAYLSWALGDVAIKLAGVEIPPAQILFFSALFALPVVLVILFFTRAGWSSLKIKRKSFMALLVIFQLLTSLSSIIAVTRLPLSNFYILFFSSALLAPIFARLFLSERTSYNAVIVIITGFVGCFLAVGGIDTSDIVLLTGITAGVGCALFYALAEVTARKANFSETSVGMIFWPIIGYLSVCGLYIAYNETPILLESVPYMAVNGLTWVLGWWFLINALQKTIVGELSSFQFLLLPYGILFDLIIWQQAPAASLLGGSILIIGSIVFLINKKRLHNLSPN